MIRKRTMVVVGIVCVFLTIAVLSSTRAYAQNWKPEKTIRMIVSDGPGTRYDIEARVLTSSLIETLGVPVIVDNVTGGGQLVGTLKAYKSKPDGYTLLFTSSSSMLLNQMIQGAPYDFAKFEFLAQVVDTEKTWSTVATTKGLDSWEDVLKLDRPFRWGTVGKGTVSYVAPVVVSAAFNLKAIYSTAYSGAEFVPAAMRGEVDGVIPPLGLVEPFYRDGNLNMLFFLSGVRNPKYPDIPCVADLGHPEVNDANVGYHVACAPPGTPKNIVDTLSEALYKACSADSSKQLQARFGNPGAWKPAPGSEVRANLENQWKLLQKYAPLLK